MLWHLIGALTATLFWVLPTQLDAYVAQSTGCHHNGTWYADKSLVPTVEKCLNCQCSKKSLVCRLKVCPEMPMPPPRGCVVVQKKNTCCPYLSCARLDAFYKIPTTRRIIAYLDHYERESIDRVVNENVLQRRSDDSEVDLYVCVKNGTVYKSGSAMSSSNLCTYCYCIGGSEKCVKPKCMLPVEGCKPIFVDSTCCPVRYDCSTKPSGKSSQEVRYRKTSNKHFLRMSQRLQRNRGCTVGKQYYAEGQKMKSDVDKPCDICFCIRGSRRCAPKKCSPALKNCIPVVPKGQCCPSSYDCGSQRDYRRAQSSRQFNLFSMLFGKDEDGDANSTDTSVKYPHDRQPPLSTGIHASTNAQLTASATTEKGIFDRIREGLEFIDSNNNQMLADNIDLIALQTTTTAPTFETSSLAPNEPSTTTEVSLLDLLLGPSENLSNEDNDIKDSLPEEKTTTDYKSLSWVDLLLGPDEEENQNSFSTTVSDKLDAAETTTHFNENYGTTNIDRLGDDFDDFSGSGEISVGVLSQEDHNNLLTIYQEGRSTTTEPSSTLQSSLETTEATRLTEETTQTLPTTLTASFEEVESTTEAIVTERVTVKVQPTVRRKTKPRPTQTTTVKPLTRTSTIAATKKKNIKTNVKTTAKPTQKPVEALQKLGALQLNETRPIAPVIKPEKNNDIFSKLLDGISDILSAEKVRNRTVVKVERNTTLKPTQKLKPTLKPITLPTPKPLPLFKPLPNVKQHVRINSKIANLTANNDMISSKHAPKQNTTFKPLPPMGAGKLSPTGIKKTVATTTTVAPSTKTTHPTKKSIITTTVKPLLIKTNPTILESEPLDNNAEPTLPPSLPNLKIIPFLPTDAVKADRNKQLYDFYHSNSQTAKIDYDLYDEANLYPSITERFPTYTDLEDGSKAEYIYKFKVEGPSAMVTSSADKLDGATGTAPGYLKYDFMGNGGQQTKGFSPPTETEGGFMPKEPLDIDEAIEGAKLEENYQVTKHIIDITTGEPMKENTTKPIEITTPDPFKDVIKTESPPDLSSLIEDKKHNLVVKQKLTPNTNSNTQSVKPLETNKKNNTHTATNMPQNFNALNVLPNKSLNKTTTLDKATLDDILMEDKNSIESFLDLLFKEEEEEIGAVSLQHTKATLTSTTIPPFKSLPQNAVNHLPANLMNTKPSAPPTKSAATSTTTTSIRPSTMKPTRRGTTPPTMRVKSKPKSSIRNSIARNSTSTMSTLPPKITKPRLSTTRKYSTTTTTTTTPTPITSTTISWSTSSTTHPFLMSPFDKLPFMDASFEVKPHSTTPPKSNSNNLMGLVHYKNSLNIFEGLEPAYESYHTTAIPPSSTSTSITSPKHIEKLSSSSPPTSSTSTATATANTPQHTSANNLIDSAGILKLAGCNIYGRMYRVGRIILELSSPCLECKCTEVGVKCGPLDC